MFTLPCLFVSWDEEADVISDRHSLKFNMTLSESPGKSIFCWEVGLGGENTKITQVGHLK